MPVDQRQGLDAQAGPHEVVGHVGGLDGFVELGEPLVVIAALTERLVGVEELPHRFQCDEVLGEGFLGFWCGDPFPGRGQADVGEVSAVQAVEARGKSCCDLLLELRS